jgi:hypothetical protein
MFTRAHILLILTLAILSVTFTTQAKEPLLNADKSLSQSNGALIQNYLKASNVDAGDRDGNGDTFGSSVAIDGDTLVIGAILEDGNNDDTLSSGAVYVFIKVNNLWVEQAYLTASNSTNDLQFGQTVAISGDTLIVGSHLEDTGASNSGAVYVFTRSSNVWTEQTILKASNPGDGDNFGYSVDIDGNYIVVGAYTEDGDDNNTQDDAGAAYVFTGSGNNWSEQAYLQASNIGSSDNFGISVAIANDTLVVGASSENGADNGLQDDVGAAYVFVRSGSNWSQQDFLGASNAQAKDNFGISVDISGNTIVVGAYLEDGLDNGSQDNSGAAYVFTRTGVIWSEQERLKSFNVDAEDLFGNAVGIDGDKIIVGALFEDGDNNATANSGAAYLFTRSNNTWAQQSYIKAANADNQDELGHGVALSGDTIIVTAPGEDSALTNDPSDNTLAAATFGAGAGYVFTPAPPDLLFSDGFE